MEDPKDPRNREKLLLRLQVIGLPKDIAGVYVNDIQKWISCSGLDWTVQRLKSLKLVLIRQQSGMEPHIWLKRNRNGTISGSVGRILRWAQISEKNFSKAIQVFMAYTFWVYPSITPEQEVKFFSGLNAVEPPKPFDLQEQFESFVCSTFKSRKRLLKSPKSLLTYRGSPSKRAPVPHRKTSVAQDRHIMLDLSLSNTNQGLWLFSQFQRIFRPLLKGYSAELRELRCGTLRNTYPPSWMQELVVGKIGFIQEPGGKLRSVANPYRIFQEALRPLGDHLYDVVGTLPWDCTHDQTKAFEPVMNALREGKTVHSVDLSNATDFFPMRLIKPVVKSVLAKKDLDFLSLWETISRCTWSSSLGDVRWKKGQPLGVYPSFAAFTFAHGALLLFLLSRIKDKNGIPYKTETLWQGEFYVVGDDVIILNSDLHCQYRFYLNQLECPFSPEKSISSKILAEFAGKVITSSGVYPQMKWREISDDNFLDICKLLGPKTRLLLRPRQRVIFDAVREMIEPYGLGFNPKGLTLEERIASTIDSPFFTDEEDCLQVLMGLRRDLQRNCYDAGFDIQLEPGEIQEMDETFDKNVKKALEKYTVWSYDTWASSIYGFSSVLGKFREFLSLPLDQSPPGRMTQLERFERLLKR